MRKPWKTKPPNFQNRDNEEPPHFIFESPREVLTSVRILFHNFLKRQRRTIKRSARGNARRNSVTSMSTGRNTAIVKYRNRQNILAPFQTILKSVYSGNYDCRTRKFRIQTDDLVGWTRQENESLTLLLAVDVSQSTFAFKKAISNILKSLREYFNRHNDRIGLISIQGIKAKIINHPTRNYRVIIKGLTELAIQGNSPIADGLFRALDMAKLEKRRKPGSKTIVILLSDCYPEPLTGKFEDVFDEPAYQKAIRAASLFDQKKISLLIINPCFNSPKDNPKSHNERLSVRLKHESNGHLIAIPSLHRDFLSQKVLKTGRKDLQEILCAIEDAFS
ncbi:hypothetical protein JW979_07150 [bacterium]|nr:hypothetical protein [candidate division CSSED10-310 bacterium]